MWTNTEKKRNGVNLENVQSLRYLGVDVTAGGGQGTETVHRNNFHSELRVIFSGNSVAGQSLTRLLWTAAPIRNRNTTIRGWLKQLTHNSEQLNISFYHNLVRDYGHSRRQMSIRLTCFTMDSRLFYVGDCPGGTVLAWGQVLRGQLYRNLKGTVMIIILLDGSRVGLTMFGSP